MSESTKLYVRIDNDDAEMSTLNGISAVLKASNLDASAQIRVMQYLLNRAITASAPRITAPTAPIALGANGASAQQPAQ